LESQFQGFLSIAVSVNLPSKSLSFQVKAMKPDSVILKDVLHKLAVQAEECVYIDDIEHYVRAARDMGMHGIHYQSCDSLILSLNQLDILV
jgi:putative hydrolase of the HAD superfamily